MSDVITFGRAATKLAMLELACRRCERKGRYRLAGLIEKHGADTSIPDWLYGIRLACPLHSTVSLYQQCMVHCPNLATVF